MRHLILAVVLFGALAGPTEAQPSNGYLFVAPGGVSCCGATSGTLHIGAGGEAVLGLGIGLGAEIGALGDWHAFSDSAVGVFSPNAYYHFGRGRRLRADPFLTGGYTLFFRNGHLDLFNFGGGFNYWFAGPLGVRIEFRDHVHTDGAAVHWWGIRFGLAFR